MVAPGGHWACSGAQARMAAAVSGQTRGLEGVDMSERGCWGSRYSVGSPLARGNPVPVKRHSVRHTARHRNATSVANSRST